MDPMLAKTKENEFGPVNEDLQNENHRHASFPRNLEPFPMNRSNAVSDFRRARRKADLQKTLARFARKDMELLSYDEVRKKLKAIESSKKELKEIPLDSIIGSAGRYTDFTRSFLPQHNSDKDRWARVHVAVTSSAGLPPIEVYQVGEAFFVIDGHHRISIARQMGSSSIEAYVRQVHTKVALSPKDKPEDLILKSEYIQFLDRTQMDKLRPGANIQVTEPGQYEVLEEHISVHRYFMGIDQDREVSYADAVMHWYDEIYMPIVEVIRERAILREFPGRTETDLFLWISGHRAALEQWLEWEVDPVRAAEDLVKETRSNLMNSASRLGHKLHDLMTPDRLETGPPPGTWRKVHFTSQRKDHLFYDVLIPVSGEEYGWYALEQASEIVHREGGRLRGLLVVPSNEEREGEHTRAVISDFQKRCQALDQNCTLVVEVGNIPRKICERAQWNDLIVLGLAHPPSKEPIAKLSSGFRTLIRRCPTPVLAVKDKPSRLSKALLAFDGSPKASEGLFIASYVAKFWELPLEVIAVQEKGEDTEKLLHLASAHLKRYEISAKLVSKDGNVADAILQTAKDEAIDWIIMGGYGMNPIVEVALGSAVDRVVRESEIPVLICR
jgi:nucleotide-binding universal stress UspA family protein